jgi:(p)ppGpp synthase/HD superfamily hydrolase
MQKGKLLGKALRIAAEAHDGQFDKGGQPYLLHVLKVLHYLKTEDEELQCIALLHDVVEDTDYTISDLDDAGMTLRILKGVDAMTKKPGQTLNNYKEQVLCNIDAIRVKMCDIRHNTDIRRLKGLREKDFERMQHYQKFYTELKETLNEPY